MASNAPVVSHGRGGERDQAGNAGKAMVDNLKALRILVQTLLSESANIPISTPSSFDTGCATRYVDGEITRQGAEGDQGDGAYSAGVRLYNPFDHRFSTTTRQPRGSARSLKPLNPHSVAARPTLALQG